MAEDRPAQTPNVKKFVKLNKTIGVTAGSAYTAGGGSYTLADGRRFSFTLDEMRSMGMPQWDFGV